MCFDDNVRRRHAIMTTAVVLKEWLAWFLRSPHPATHVCVRLPGPCDRAASIAAIKQTIVTCSHAGDGENKNTWTRFAPHSFAKSALRSFTAVRQRVCLSHHPDADQKALISVAWGHAPQKHRSEQNKNTSVGRSLKRTTNSELPLLFFDYLLTLFKSSFVIVIIVRRNTIINV